MPVDPNAYEPAEHERYRPLIEPQPNLDDTQPNVPVIPGLDEDTSPTLSFSQPVRVPKPATLSSTTIRWVLIGTAIMAMVALAAIMLLIGTSLGDQDARRVYSVTLQTGGTGYTINTQAETIADLLEAQSIVLEEGDYVSADLNAPVHDGMIISVDPARTVAVTVDGETRILRTSETTPSDVLRSAAIELNPGDQIFVDGEQVTQSDLPSITRPVLNIVIQRATQVRVIDGDDIIEVATMGTTVGDAIYDAGIEVFLADQVSPDVSTPLQAGMEIVLDRSRPFAIIVDGERLETRTKATTIGAALAEVGVILTGLDYTIPAEDVLVVPNTSVRVIRVIEEVISEQETIPHDTVYLADTELALDTRQVSQVGQDGVIERTMRVRYENGIEVDRLLESEVQVQEPQNQVISYGTNVIIRTVDTPQGTVEYWRKLRVYATSYHPAALGGDNITSIGMELRKGIIGIDPDIIPYRTNMYVPGYGQGIAADTGAPRNNPYWIDLGYSDEDWVNWHEWIDIYLLTPVPNDIAYLLPTRAQGGPQP